MRDEALAAIAAAADLDALKQVRTEHAGDRSPLALANREIGALPPQARKDAGQRVGQARGAVNQALAAAPGRARGRGRGADAGRGDRRRHAARGTARTTGARHPITMMSERIADVFVAMGWEVAEGPLVEAEWLNFDALNLGPDHPARTMQDTFWTEPAEHHVVLRTHTSPGAGAHDADPHAADLRRLPRPRLPHRRVRRHAQPDVPPGRGPGRSTRASRWPTSRAPSTTSPPSMFGEGITTRFRPSYFPFTEPSAEVDLLCFVCRGQRPAVEDCRTCKGEGWIEWGGCGVVNPRVLTACGVDTERYTGFAFGMGIDRTLMFRHGVADMRDMFEGDVRFTTAFGTEI